MEWIDVEVEMPQINREVLGVVCPFRLGEPYLVTCVREQNSKPFEVRELFSGGLFRISYWAELPELPKKRQEVK